MICYKCKRKLPGDSEFCQYCGNKLGFVVAAPAETVVEETKKVEIPVEAPATPVSPIVEDELNIDDMTPEEAAKALVEMQAKYVIEIMDKNIKNQPDNEGDEDFGLVPKKPIYTLAIQSVDGEREYLNRLYTVNGEKIRYNRLGSTSAEGINGMVDIYETFLPNGQPYKTIYINMYGATKSTKSPKGFIFASPKTPNSVRISKPTINRTKFPSNKLVFSTNISSIILTVLAMFSIIIAINVQDFKRNYYENWNPTVVYIVLFLILGTVLGFAIYSLVKERFKLISILSTIPVIAAIITMSEGSIDSYGYYDYYEYSSVYEGYQSYMNDVVVGNINAFWITCVFLGLLITLIPVTVAAFKKINDNWHKSISYRENCYKRVAQIHSYLEKGIITEEEFEKTKSDILKHIQ